MVAGGSAEARDLPRRPRGAVQHHHGEPGRIEPRSTLLSWRSIAQILLAWLASGAGRSLRMSSVAAADLCRELPDVAGQQAEIIGVDAEVT